MIAKLQPTSLIAGGYEKFAFDVKRCDSVLYILKMYYAIGVISVFRSKCFI